MRDIRIAFVGDSFVNGTGDPMCLGWVGRVCKSVQQNNKTIELTAYNLGIRRETSSDILKRFQNELNSRMIDGERFIAVFSFGVNDCVKIDDVQRVNLQTSVKNLETILNTVKEKYDEVLFIMPPYIADDEINERIEVLIEHYSEVCNDKNVPYINISNTLNENIIWQQETTQNDGAHPKAKGYELFADLILENKNWKNLWKLD